MRLAKVCCWPIAASCDEEWGISIFQPQDCHRLAFIVTSFMWTACQLLQRNRRCFWAQVGEQDVQSVQRDADVQFALVRGAFQ